MDERLTAETMQRDAARREVKLALDGVEVVTTLGARVPLLTLCLADESLVGELVELVNRCYRGEGSWTTEAGFVRGQRVTDERVRAYMREMDIIVALEQSSRRVIACIKTGTCTDTVVGPLSAPAGYIGLVCVHPDYQSSGLGRALMSIAEKRCADVYHVTLMVMDVIALRHDLIAWYGSLGYQLTDRTTPAGPFLAGKGETALAEFNFVLLEKRLNAD